MMKKIVYFLLVAMASVAFCSCGDDEPKIDENAFTVDGIKHDIAKVGLYYDDNADGYNILFVDNAAIDMSNRLKWEDLDGKCSDVLVGVSGSNLGNKITKPTNFYDPQNKWNMELGARNIDELHIWYGEDLMELKKIDFYVNYEGETLIAKISAKCVKDGVTRSMSLTYKGTPFVSDKLIY